MRSLNSIPAIQYKDSLRAINQKNFFHEVGTDNYQFDKTVRFPPELDLLHETLELKGVMQIELSRGCSFSCSFCPRGHKGKWVNGKVSVLDTLLFVLDQLYKKFPSTTRKLYLIDEEFVGYDRQSLNQTLEISKCFERFGFRFEAMTRLDQMYKANKTTQWLVNRIAMWRQLHKYSMDRVLFGIESGIDSILKRFNKRITSMEIVNGIRLLSLCGIPVRFTYITFDPLMSFEELIATYFFQGRTDLLMNPCPDLSDHDIANAFDDNLFIESQSSGQSVYKAFSYMLVTLECLLNSSYLSRVEKLGLGGDINLSMGRQDVHFLDSRIEIMSYVSQLWIDRNFSLDYMLKSILKLCNPNIRARVAFLREILKEAAYSLLGQMLFIVTGKSAILPNGVLLIDRLLLKALHQKWKATEDQESQLQLFITLMDTHFDQLVDVIRTNFTQTQSYFPDDINILISQEINTWQTRSKWSLINGQK